jgi:hypothetical protein
MGLLKYALPTLVAVFGIALAYGDDDEGGGGFSTTKEAQQRDFDALQEYIKSKRAIMVKDKGGNLTISGDIRAEYYYMHAKTHNKSKRGYETRHQYPNSAYNTKYPKVSKSEYKRMSFDEKAQYKDNRDHIKPPIATSEPDVEANLIFDYVAERGWGTVQLQMSNPMGIREVERKADVYDSTRALYGSGIVNNLALRKAYLGYNIWEQGTSRFDVELGRRRLYDVFDSRVQFGSFFDGILARMSSSYEGITDLSLKMAVFVIDQTSNHYGEVGEIGFLNLADSGMDLKYSLINWERHAPNRWGRHHPLGCRFLNSQVTAAYNISPDVVNTKAQVYGAGLINHAADATEWTHHKLQNKAFYVGARAGEVLRKGDMAADLCYQWVEAQAVPERDISGMARDTPMGYSFYNRRSGGFANYKGVRIQGLYGVTDNITIDTHFDRVHQICRRIGGKHRSYEFYIAAIFAF